jgi:hypothetical protein
MLGTASIQRLVEGNKAESALCGNIMPANNNNSILALDDISTVTVLREEVTEAVPVAFGLVNQCSPVQVYCNVVVASNKYDDVFVTVEEVKAKGVPLGAPEKTAHRHSVLQIANVVKELPDLSTLPQYFSAFQERSARPLHQCVVDALVDQTTGHHNVSLKCNYTVDLYDKESDVSEKQSDDIWRDFDGFIVGDRYRYSQLEIQKNALVEVVRKYDQNSFELRLEPLSAKTFSLFTDYDHSVTTMDREEYLEYLFALPGIAGTVALDESMQPVGYILSRQQHILQCYAESGEIMCRLFADHCSKMDAFTLTLFIKLDESVPVTEALRNAAKSCRRIRRFHTKTVPRTVEWTKVFSLNIGVNLF